VSFDNVAIPATRVRGFPVPLLKGFLLQPQLFPPMDDYAISARGDRWGTSSVIDRRRLVESRFSGSDADLGSQGLASCD